ncbi:MAG: MBL fold metallo-hydrolase [Candidatus Sumerlaea sp.]|uniref:Hydroxyacylglutathione hydrolase n=1 Tax=Sumerlaea chitinivorans TaxID=2250252 RepID=A0A2Z4Y5L2_SUMC1|nr:Hydroxyacylglutathione hydrolase [Candidatus Sumerlaea chitinivorans]GIX45020.1 MAG: MBL fold metallo-hydrolase [Candidatus Sumerlaea sp.]
MNYRIHLLVGTPFESNCYVLTAPDGAAVVIDPNEHTDEILEILRREKARLEVILNTHGHCDHVWGNASLAEVTGAPIAVHELDAPMLTNAILNGSAIFGFPYSPVAPQRLLQDGEDITAGSMVLRVLHTPGHSPGSVCYYDERNGHLFTGDLLFQGSVGRTDLPGGSYEELMTSLRRKILLLSDETLVYPGHGPSTTIGDERRTNPFLRFGGSGK